MSEKIKHTPGDWERVELLVYALDYMPDHNRNGTPYQANRFWARVQVDRRMAKEGEAEANACLIHRAKQVPHDCDDPQCPGNVNRRKLEAFEKMREALELAQTWLANCVPLAHMVEPMPMPVIASALAAAKEAGPMLEQREKQPQ